MAIAFSHQGSAQTAGAASLPVTVTINPGDTVMVLVFGGANPPYSISDDGGNTYSSTSSTAQTQLFSCLSAASAATTVTVTHASTDMSVIVCTYTGVGSLGAPSSTSFLFATSTSKTVTITADNSFLLTGIGWQKGAPGTTAAATSGTARANVASTTTLDGAAILDNTAATSGSSVTNAVNFSGGTGVGRTISVELKPAGDQSVLVANSLRVTNSLQANSLIQTNNALLVTIDNDWVDD